jgi:hypothetical protein
MKLTLGKDARIVDLDPDTIDKKTAQMKPCKKDADCKYKPKDKPKPDPNKGQSYSCRLLVIQIVPTHLPTE